MTTLSTKIDDHFMDDFKNSLMDMQQKMQATFSNLDDLELTGESDDKTVRVIMTATYNFVDIQFSEHALVGGVQGFKQRIREAWKNLTQIIQKTTQAKTIELLQNMRIPDNIRNLSLEEEVEDK